MLTDSSPAISALVVRPETLEGKTVRIRTVLGNCFVTINELRGNPSELFLSQGKAGSDLAAMTEAIGRLCSVVLRMASPVSGRDRLRLIAKHLSQIGGRNGTEGTYEARSVPDAVAMAIEQYLDHKEEADVEQTLPQP